MRRFVDTVRDDWPRLLLEFVILVVGISASFALEGWREGREDARAERRAWQTVHDDLAADTAALARGIARLDAQVRACAALLAEPAPDSVDVYMDRTISYASFAPAGNGYAQLRATAGARTLQNRALFNALASLQTREYERARAWDLIDEQVVLERMVPYLEAHAPASYAAAEGGTALAGLRPTYEALRARVPYRNLLGTSRSFKQAHREVYAEALAAARRVLGLVRAELAARG